MGRQMRSRPEQRAKIAAADKAVDLLWFVHGLSFNLIGSRFFCDAVKKLKLLLVINLATGRRYLRRTSLQDTSDGWRNKKRRSYHNFILVAANGPIFLSLKDVTWKAGTAKAISEVFETRALDESVYDRIGIGCTDMPSANVSAWKSLEAAHPKQIWIGCMAHELCLLFKDWVQKVPAVKDLYRRLKNITIWIRNHGDISTQFEEKLRAQFSDKRKWTIKPYMPGDTRMGTMYKLADRALQLKDILSALVTDPKYKASAQAAIQGYNGSTKAENRIPKGANGITSTR
jgi:hypothetical protein